MKIVNIYTKIKKTSYTKVIKNSFYLTILEGIELCIPFIALPYIIKTVGSDNYGKIVFAQSIVSYFAIVVNFGINIIAAKEVAINQENKKEIQKVFGAVLCIKTSLCLICLLIFSLLILLWDKTQNDWALYYCAYGICFADITFTRWLFQGIEKMFMITLIRSSSLIIYVALLFLLVSKKGDYYLIPLLQSTCLILTSALGIVYTIKKERIKPVFPEWKYIWKMTKECIPFFFSRASLTVNASIATTAIGLTLSNHLVACYDIAVKIAKVAIIPVDMVGQAVYPHNSKYKDSAFALKVFGGIVILSLSSLLVLYFCIPYIVDYLGKHEMYEAISISRLLLFYSFMGSMSVFLGTPLLVAWGYSKPFNNSIYVATGILAGLYYIYSVFEIHNIYLYCAVLICAETGLAFFRLCNCIKYRIISIKMVFPI